MCLVPTCHSRHRLLTSAACTHRAVPVEIETRPTLALSELLLLLLLPPLLTTSAGGCPPGTGGPTCEECKANFFSPGGTPGNPHPKCKPCGLHFHSPPGSISAEFCECDAGFGAHPDDDTRCVPCALGTFNPGPGNSHRDAYAAKASVAAVVTAKKKRKDGGVVLQTPVAQACQRCNAAHPKGVFTTLQSGSMTASDCVCMPGHGGSGCAACPEVSEDGAVCCCPRLGCICCLRMRCDACTDSASAASEQAGGVDWSAGCCDQRPIRKSQ